MSGGVGDFLGEYGRGLGGDYMNKRWGIREENIKAENKKRFGRKK